LLLLLLLLLLSSSLSLLLLDYHVFICLGFVTPFRGICFVPPTQSDSATTKDSLLTTRLTHSNRAVAGTGGAGDSAAPGGKMNILNKKN